MSRLPGDLVGYSKSSLTSVGRLPLVPDPYESRTCQVIFTFFTSVSNITLTYSSDVLLQRTQLKYCIVHSVAMYIPYQNPYCNNVHTYAGIINILVVHYNRANILSVYNKTVHILADFVLEHCAYSSETHTYIFEQNTYSSCVHTYCTACFLAEHIF